MADRHGQRCGRHAGHPRFTWWWPRQYHRQGWVSGNQGKSHVRCQSNQNLCYMLLTPPESVKTVMIVRMRLCGNVTRGEFCSQCHHKHLRNWWDALYFLAPGLLITYLPRTASMVSSNQIRNSPPSSNIPDYLQLYLITHVSQFGKLWLFERWAYARFIARVFEG